ncbi:MAG: hypothetical protein ABJ004_02450 [Cyclobacteriaceae bacterium]
MSTHSKHPDKERFHFVTFTCFRWLHLFEETKIYDYLTFWFKKLRESGYLLNGYVIMPNHMHLIVYPSKESKDMNKAFGEAKRFLAYEIVKRLKSAGKDRLLDILTAGVQHNERIKGKRHQVFRLSFDAKKLEGDAVERVLDYIHHNLVSGIWNLVDDFTDYPYSSAGYYDCEKQSYYTIVYFREV